VLHVGHHMIPHAGAAFNDLLSDFLHRSATTDDALT
jgi:hypothetical protein